MQVTFGSPNDIAPWMELVTLMAWNFPGLETQEALEDHKATVLRFMDKKQALCIKEDGCVLGVLLFSRNRNMICCLGVHPHNRRRGIASALLTAALTQLDRTRPVTVSTFLEHDERSPAPRALYRKFGFQPADLIEEFGCPNQRFILPANDLRIQR